MTLYALYFALGPSDGVRQSACRALFKDCIDVDVLGRIRRAIQGGEVIGNPHFCEQIARQLERRVEKSAAWRRPQEKIFS